MASSSLFASLTFATELQAGAPDWLWPTRIPRGKLTLLVGDPGVGKSLLIADLAARVSAGLPWPDAAPSNAPSHLPTFSPSPPPSAAAGAAPSVAPSHLPTFPPSPPSSAAPSPAPSHLPTFSPSPPPSAAPPATPSHLPTFSPSHLSDDAPRRARAGVLLVCPEDSPTDTILPRLAAAGANPELIAFCTTATDMLPLVRPDPVLEFLRRRPASIPLVLPDHLDVLAMAVRGIVVPHLLVIDPLHALLSPAAQSSATALAETIAGLEQIATAYTVAVLVVGHLSKTRTPHTLYRVRGSLALTAAARAVHLLTADPDHADRRHLVPLKTIHGPRAVPLAFDITPGPRLLWHPPGQAQPDAPLTPAPDLYDLPPDATSALADARAWLSDRLTPGPAPIHELIHAARLVGIAFRTLRRAKRLLAVRSTKPTNESPWLWSLPERSDNQGGQMGGTQS